MDMDMTVHSPRQSEVDCGSPQLETQLISPPINEQYNKGSFGIMKENTFGHRSSIILLFHQAPSAKSLGQLIPPNWPRISTCQIVTFFTRPAWTSGWMSHTGLIFHAVWLCVCVSAPFRNSAVHTEWGLLQPNPPNRHLLGVGSQSSYMYRYVPEVPWFNQGPWFKPGCLNFQTPLV